MESIKEYNLTGKSKILKTEENQQNQQFQGNLYQENLNQASQNLKYAKGKKIDINPIQKNKQMTVKQNFNESENLKVQNQDLDQSENQNSDDSISESELRQDIQDLIKIRDFPIQQEVVLGKIVEEQQNQGFSQLFSQEDTQKDDIQNNLSQAFYQSTLANKDKVKQKPNQSFNQKNDKQHELIQKSQKVQQMRNHQKQTQEYKSEGKWQKQAKNFDKKIRLENNIFYSQPKKMSSQIEQNKGQRNSEFFSELTKQKLEKIQIKDVITEIQPKLEINKLQIMYPVHQFYHQFNIQDNWQNLKKFNDFLQNEQENKDIEQDQINSSQIQITDINYASQKSDYVTKVISDICVNGYFIAFVQDKGGICLEDMLFEMTHNDKQIIKLFRDLLRIVIDLHRIGIVHRNINLRSFKYNNLKGWKLGNFLTSNFKDVVMEQYWNNVRKVAEQESDEYSPLKKFLYDKQMQKQMQKSLLYSQLSTAQKKEIKEKKKEEDFVYMVGYDRDYFDLGVVFMKIYLKERLHYKMKAKNMGEIDFIMYKVKSWKQKSMKVKLNNMQNIIIYLLDPIKQSRKNINLQELLRMIYKLEDQDNRVQEKLICDQFESYRKQVISQSKPIQYKNIFEVAQIYRKLGLYSDCEILLDQLLGDLNDINENLCYQIEKCMADLKFETHFYKEAYKHYQSVSQMRFIQNQQEAECQVFMLEGYCYLQLDIPYKGIQILKKVWGLLNQQKNQNDFIYLQVQCLVYLAKGYLLIEDYDISQKNLNNAKILMPKNHNNLNQYEMAISKHINIIYYKMSKIFEKMGFNQEQLRFAKLALDQWRNEQDNILQKEQYSKQDFLHGLKKYEKYYSHLMRLNNISDNQLI
ncbi:Protein kinase-like domain [Pseudocohnilembus persalinus]|uniref:Protein kinase-like domain n=1 Tax=Pseudocohnilembus persalinus TaxID=266149 RepID=A0A0V0QVW1_PSEPJ|nr:Protein kinase-like domain [Pseudocohnilembus persalinus]|eukprot:KRX06356.1 Protein kinase-like domain [Pseudocohnilembus persalinus]